MQYLIKHIHLSSTLHPFTLPSSSQPLSLIQHLNSTSQPLPFPSLHFTQLTHLITHLLTFSLIPLTLITIYN